MAKEKSVLKNLDEEFEKALSKVIKSSNKKFDALKQDISEESDKLRVAMNKKFEKTISDTNTRIKKLKKSRKNTTNSRA